MTMSGINPLALAALMQQQAPQQAILPSPIAPMMPQGGGIRPSPAMMPMMQAQPMTMGGGGAAGAASPMAGLANMDPELIAKIRGWMAPTPNYTYGGLLGGAGATSSAMGASPDYAGLLSQGQIPL